MNTITDNYLYTAIESSLNSIINNCNPINEDISGCATLEKDLFKNIISVQYHVANKTLFIETETFNYVLSESDGQIKICEFWKKEQLEEGNCKQL